MIMNTVKQLITLKQLITVKKMITHPSHLNLEKRMKLIDHNSTVI